MKQYLDVLQRVLDEGEFKEDRTGTGTKSLAGCYFEHKMGDGFPLLTTKRVPFALVASELEFFIHGKTDKYWLLDRNNHIWDEWCSSDCVPYSHDPVEQEKMKAERELGPIYGFQWRHFGAKYINYSTSPDPAGIDQLQRVLDMLKKDPSDRRMIVSSWNPAELHRMALPPCHWSWQVTVTDGKLNLMWNQRSVDSFLGLPFNIASYGLLLHLIAKESGFGEGRLVGFLGDTHLYRNHLTQVDKQLSRTPGTLPTIETENWQGIFNWEFEDSKPVGYDPQPGIKAPIAV